MLTLSLNYNVLYAFLGITLSLINKPQKNNVGHANMSQITVTHVQITKRVRLVGVLISWVPAEFVIDAFLDMNWLLDFVLIIRDVLELR